MNQQLVDDVIRMALAEDAPWGDVTSEAFVPETAVATAVLNAREPGVAGGLEVFARTFMLVDAHAEVTLHISDGDTFTAGQQLATVSGNARAVLRAERIALNLSQRMSGIATQTAAYVAQVAGTHARIVDTRKTTPGLRALERHAVRCGGGHNHRFSLSDAVMAKDNHLAVLAAEGIDLGEAIRRARKLQRKKMQREGIFREMKLRGHYEKPSEKRARERAEAIRRYRKLQRKRAQREGLLPK